MILWLWNNLTLLLKLSELCFCGFRIKIMEVQKHFCYMKGILVYAFRPKRGEGEDGVEVTGLLILLRLSLVGTLSIVVCQLGGVPDNYTLGQQQPATHYWASLKHGCDKSRGSTTWVMPEHTKNSILISHHRWVYH